MAFSFSAVTCREALSRKTGLAPIPVQIATVAIYIAVLAAQLPALMPCARIISAVKIAPQLSPVVRDFGLVAPDVASITPSVFGKHRACTQPNQQK
jgi:hypothetical protein